MTCSLPANSRGLGRLHFSPQFSDCLSLRPPTLLNYVFNALHVSFLTGGTTFDLAVEVLVELVTRHEDLPQINFPSSILPSVDIAYVEDETPETLSETLLHTWSSRTPLHGANRFSEDLFTLVLFHYDGRTTEWDQYEWSKRAIHVSVPKQTKWWYAKRFLHPDIVAPYDYIFIWDEDLGLEHFSAEECVSFLISINAEECVSFTHLRVVSIFCSSFFTISHILHHLHHTINGLLKMVDTIHHRDLHLLEDFFLLFTVIGQHACKVVLLITHFPSSTSRDENGRSRGHTNIEMWKITKLIKGFIPGKIYVQLLPSSNIKSRANRQSVLSSLAITCAQQGLKLYNKVPSNGLRREVLHKFTVDLPRKHERGGQSVLHFARLSMEKRHNYVRKTGELATLLYINPATIQPNVAASTKRLSSVKFIQEKKLIAKYFEEISLDTGKYELKNSTSGEVVVNHFGKDQETDQSNFLRTEKDASA
ncbi:hypothetical protein Bca4012_061535 [Brassica carinata]